MFSFSKLIEKKGGALVMGIINLTPDSFSDGGEAFSLDGVLKKVNELINDGADIIDVGACSTAPNNALASSDEELARLKLFLPSIVNESTVPVSVDTFRAEIAEYALGIGADIINDESGAFSVEMAKLIKDTGAGWIFMHTGGGGSSEAIEYENVTDAVLGFFSEMKMKALSFGLAESQLCYDCGIGFGKTRDDDIALLAECERLSRFSPLLIGVSRKRVIGHITGIEDPKSRDFASAVAAAITVSDGAQIVRVHNVKITNEALAVYGAVGGGVL